MDSNLRVLFSNTAQQQQKNSHIRGQIWVCWCGLHLAVWLFPAQCGSSGPDLSLHSCQELNTFTIVLSGQHWAVPLFKASLSAPHCNCFQSRKRGQTGRKLQASLLWPPIMVLIDKTLSRWWRVFFFRRNKKRDQENGWISRRIAAVSVNNSPRWNWFTAGL